MPESNRDNFIRTSDLVRYVRSLSGDDVMVGFHDGPPISRAATDTRKAKLVLPKISSSLSPQELDTVRLTASVEADRLRSGSVYGPDGETVEGALYHSLETLRIRRKLSRIYDGDAQAARSAVSGSMNKFVASMVSNPEVLKNLETPEIQKYLGSLAAIFSATGDSFPGTDEAVRRLLACGSGAEDAYTKINEAGLIAKAAGNDLIEGSLNIARDIINLLDDDDDGEGEGDTPPTPEPSESPSNDEPDTGEGEGEGEEGSPDDSPQGEPDGDGEDSEPGEVPKNLEDGAEGEPDGETVELPAPVIDYASITPDKIDEEGSPTGCTINYDSWVPSEEDIDVPDDIVHVYTTTDLDNPAILDRDWDDEYDLIKKTLEDSDCCPAALANRIRVILQNRAQDTWEGGQKSGRLNKKAIKRLCMPTIGSGSWNSTIWKKKVDGVSLKDQALVILLDQSGSMASYTLGGAIQVASVACCLLASAICQSLRIPVEVLGFTDKTVKEIDSDGYPVNVRSDMDGTLYKCTIREIKRFDEYLTMDRLMERSAKAIGVYGMGSNDDGVYVMDAVNRLRRRPEKTKRLIVLSDGSPAGRVSGGQSADLLHSVLNEVYNDGDIDIYALGIADDSVEKFYKDYAVVQKVDELVEALFSIVEQKLLSVNS